MRDKKISILLFVSFLLLLASFLILCTWMYNYFFDARPKPATLVNKAKAIETTRDSLLRIYTTTIQSLESQLGNTYVRSDSIESGLSLKLDEYYLLKEELVALLKKPVVNDDFKIAKLKITELQQRMQDLRTTTSSVAQENARLKKIIEGLNGGKSNSVSGQANNVSATTKSSINIIPFTSYELNLTAVTDEADGETDVFSTQKKIVGSFAVKNSLNLDNSEIIVVVTQPNGRVLQKSAWESGSFQSPDGKKIYSVKMNFGYNSGEAKKLSFLIETDKFTRGNYTMQVYSNGKVIGKITKLLS
ncbi:MAG: hypothetical protein ABIO05_08300 [Ferruginibacter sp.]